MRIDTRMNGTGFEAKLSDGLAFADSPTFRLLLKEIVEARPKTCVFDLSGLVSIDSAGLGMFMIALEEAKRGGWSLTLRSPQEQVKSLLDLANFDKLFVIEA